jgi:Leucine-rich repeat (LRR) protein
LEEIPSLTIPTLEALVLGTNKIRIINDGTFDALVSLRKLYLDNNALENIPNLPLSMLEFLNLNDNNISKINVDAFDALVNLNTFFFEGNSLEEIPSLRLSMVEILSLNHNKIHRIKNGAFDVMTNLKILELFANDLEEIPKLHISTLEYLDLGSNKIRLIHDDAFDSLHSLKRLDLEHNDLETIPKLQGLHLDVLLLHNNKIQQQSHDFEDSAVKHLHIDNNNITNLSALSKLSASLELLDASFNPLGLNSAAELFALLKSLTRLQTIDLRSCSLTSFPDISQLNRRMSLHISNNPFNCNCRMLWMHNSSTIISDYTSISCASPPEHSGKFYREISRDDLCSGEFSS